MLGVRRRKYFYLRNEGFTAIELLLGLAIFSIISVMIYGVFWGGIKLDNRAEVQNRLLREVRGTFDLLERELENMVFYDFSASYPDKVSFQSSGSEIVFLLANGGDLKVVRYFLQAPENVTVVKTVIGETYAKNIRVKNIGSEDFKEFYLIRAEQNFIDFLNDESFSDEEQEIVAVHMRENGLRFSFGVSSSEEVKDAMWTDSWDFDSLPAHIRVEADFILPEKVRSIKTFTKKILVPSGSVGSEDDSHDI